MEPRDYSRYEVWAPHAGSVTIRVDGHEHRMRAEEDGWFALPEVAARIGARYAFRLDGDSSWLPDPRSLSQPDGVHADSEVADPRVFDRDEEWSGRSFRGDVIYELHVGTFTAGPDARGGTFDSAIAHLDDLVDLGVAAVEVMPVAPFPGRRGWGYDGVGLYGVHAAYGGPAAFARFIRAAHERGLAVVLDVVHNHLGPDGNYLGRFGPYFTDHHHTPWGAAVNLDTAGSAQVRAFVLGSARQWLVDMGIDGLRLDAVHELKDDSPRHLLAELADAIAQWEVVTGRELTLIAESDRNDPRTVTPTIRGGLGMGMQWADDIHHALHAWISGERQGYYVDFGSAEVLRRTLTRVFEHDGRHSTFRGRPWGAPVDPDAEGYDAHSFVAFLEDHDQVGNRALGDRVHQGLSPAEHAAAIALILLGPATPMLFQGEEWATTTPFTYFTDHDDELGPLVTAGRREEFSAMGWGAAEVPDPQAEETFLTSILDHGERTRAEHARMLEWYRTLIALRQGEPDLHDPRLSATEVEILREEAVVLRRGHVAVLVSRAADDVTWTPGAGRAAIEVLTTFGDVTVTGTRVDLHGPGAVIVRTA